MMESVLGVPARRTQFALQSVRRNTFPSLPTMPATSTTVRRHNRVGMRGKRFNVVPTAVNHWSPGSSRNVRKLS